MTHRVSSPANPGDEPPGTRYHSEDATWRQEAWQATGSITKTRKGVEEYIRASPSWSLAMQHLIEDMFRTFADDPRERPKELRDIYRGRLVPERRLRADMLWSLYSWTTGWVRGEGRLAHHQLVNSKSCFGIPDPAERVLDFLMLLYLRMERKPFASESSSQVRGTRRRGRQAAH